MLQLLFHAWERRLAAVTSNRVVRPFEWGLDWIGGEDLDSWVSRAMADTDAFFTPPPTDAYILGNPSPGGDRLLRFPSAFPTPHSENNTVYCRYFPARTAPEDARRAAVLVLPQWNADAEGHVGLARLVAMNGMSALRLT